MDEHAVRAGLTDRRWEEVLTGGQPSHFYGTDEPLCRIVLCTLSASHMYDTEQLATGRPGSPAQ